MVTSADERRFYHVLIRVVFVAVTVASLIALFGEQFWVAELFTHYRLYYLLAQALLALIFLYSRRPLLLALAVLCAVPNALIVGPYLMPLFGGKNASADIGAGLDIVALNVNYHNDEFARIDNYLRDRDPDIIVIGEFTPAWRDELEFLHQSYPYRAGKARPDQWGLGVYSRVPFSEVEVIDLAKTDTVHVRFVVAAGGEELEVFAVHLLPPTSADLALGRNRQLEDLAVRVSASDYPCLVVGDLNLTPFSPYFSEFIDQSGLQDARRADGFHVTWPAHNVPIWIPIDHALVDPEIDVVRVRAGEDVGSDHFPLEVFVSPGMFAQGAR